MHLDSPLKSLALRDADLREKIQTSSRTALTRIVDTAISEDAIAVLIAGDLFDGAERSARTAAFLMLQMERLRDCGIGVFYVKGNHDAENPLTGELNLPDNVHVFDGRGGKVQLAENVWIHGVSFAKRHAPQSLLPKFHAPVEGAINIAMLHTSLAGAEGHDPYAPCTVAELTAAGFDYWALGHIHRRQVHSEAPWIVMPGTPQGRDIGESGPKSSTLLTIEKTIKIEEVPTSVVEFLHIQIDTTDTDSDDNLRDMLRQTMRDTSRNLTSESAVIRLELTGHPRRYWQILRDQDVWEETAAQYARDTGTLWLDKVVFHLSDTVEVGHSATDELAEIMATICCEAGFMETCRTEIESILRALPPQHRDKLLPNEDAMDQLSLRLSKAGAERILAQMKGATG